MSISASLSSGKRQVALGRGQNLIIHRSIQTERKDIGMSAMSSQELDISTHQQQSASEGFQSQTATDSVHMEGENNDHSEVRILNERHPQDRNHVQNNDQKNFQSPTVGEGRQKGGQMTNKDNRNDQTKHSYQGASGSRDNCINKSMHENWHPDNKATSRRKGGQGTWNDGNMDSYRNQDEDSDFILSRTLSSILRHNAENYKLKLMKGGFLYVNDILRNVNKLKDYTVDDVRRIVDTNDKKRFALEEEDGTNKLKIRANQGHTLQGLNRMTRNHIHFAPGEPGHNGVISGMRKTCEVMIFLDMEKALKDGLKFFRSANNVILCPGNKDGIIFPCYFQGVKDRRGYRIEFDSKICSLTKKADGTPKASTSQANGKTKVSTNNANGKTKGSTNNANDKTKGSTNNANDKTVNSNTTQANVDKRKLNRKQRKKHEKEGDWEEEDNEGTNIEQKQTSEYNKSELKEFVQENWVEEVQDKTCKETVSAGQCKVENAYTRIDEKSPDVKIKQHLAKKNFKAEELKEDISEEDQVHSEWVQVPQLMNIEESVAIVDKLLSAPPDELAICCAGEDLDKPDGHIRLLVILIHPNIYVYHLHDGNLNLVKDGHLDKLLAHKSINKVFHDIGSVSPSLTRQYGIQLDSTPIWDSELMYSFLSHMDIEGLRKYGIFDDTFKQWQTENEKFAKEFSGEDINEEALLTLTARGKLMLKLYECWNRFSTPTKRSELRKAIYAKAIPKEVTSKLPNPKLEQEKESKSVSSKPEGSNIKQQKKNKSPNKQDNKDKSKKKK